MQVYLNVYDVTNTQTEAQNDTIVKLNNITRQIGLGGVFHGGVEYDNAEWSFGYCERGSGVYSCQPKKNPMYVYRETIDLGLTIKTKQEVRDILRKLKETWPGKSYDLLAQNCCHFCEVICKELGVKPPPGWLNRFATSADATVTFTNEAVVAMRAFGQQCQSTANYSMSWIRENVQRIVAAQAANSQQQQQQQQQQQGGEASGSQGLPPHVAADAPQMPRQTSPARPVSARWSSWLKDTQEKIGAIQSSISASAAGLSNRSSHDGLHNPQRSRSSSSSADGNASQRGSGSGSGADREGGARLLPSLLGVNPQPTLHASTAHQDREDRPGASVNVSVITSGGAADPALSSKQAAAAAAPPQQESLI